MANGDKISRFWLCTSGCRVDKWDDRRTEVMKRGDWRMDRAFLGYSLEETRWAGGPRPDYKVRLDTNSVAWFASLEWPRLLADMGETGRRVEFWAADSTKGLRVFGHMSGWWNTSLLGMACEGGPLDLPTRSGRLSEWTPDPPPNVFSWPTLRQLLIDKKLS